MRFAIVGTGGVGGVFGARLAHSGCDVTFIARGAHLDAMRKNGLEIRCEALGDLTIHPVRAVSNPADVGIVDFVFITVKLWDTDAVVETLGPIIGAETAVISFQNGIQKDEILRKHFGADHVVGGVSYVASFIEGPGVIHQRGTVQKLIFGEYGGRKSERTEALRNACLTAGIEAEIPADIEKAIWEKFAFLVAMSSLTSATRQTIGPVRSNERTRALLVDVVNEVVAVANACGVKLDKELADRALDYWDALKPDVTASMMHDLTHGNRLELPWLGGAVVDLGVKHSVPTPVNRVITAILWPYINGKVPATV